MFTNSSDLFVKSGGNFPFRRYINGTSNNIPRLNYLLNIYSPEYDVNGFIKERIIDKVVSKIPSETHVIDLFEAGPKNISHKDEWNLNSVIDQYTETARTSSPGYGKNFSPLDIWFKSSFESLRNRIFKDSRTLYEARESIYKQGEVRPAYITESISLYNYVRKKLLSNTTNPSVLDIMAFGERLVAAAATGFYYYGVDPDPNLIEGINRLVQDVKSIKRNFSYEIFNLPLEHISPPYKLDFVSFSPPPYDAEPYTGGDRQTHKVYKDFKSWFNGFVKEIINRAFDWLREGGVLGFSVLDRDVPHKIVYTEAMILYAMKVGFKPIYIFSLSSGTPWWLFVKDSSFVDSTFDYRYPELNINPDNSIAMEYLRYICSSYVTELLVNHNFFVNPAKAKDIIGRILMSKVPYKEDHDYLFPDSMSEVIVSEEYFNNLEDIIFPIVIQTPDSGYRRVINNYNSVTEVLLDVFNTIIKYLNWIQNTVEYDNFKKVLEVSEYKSFVNLQINKRYFESGISFIRKRGLFTERTLEHIKLISNNIILWSTSDRGVNKNNVQSCLRYDSVGANNHHFTRPFSRIEAISKITDVNANSIVDLFATPFNANSKLYASVYPDVDLNSLGNFFTYDGGNNKVFMANPPPYNGFNEKMLYRLMNVYMKSDTIIFYSTTVWTDDGEMYIANINMGKDPEFDDFENYYVLSTLWKDYKYLVRAVYILDYNLHPTYDMAKGKKYTVKLRDNTESVGVIISEKEVDLSNLNMLSNGMHVIF